MCLIFVLWFCARIVNILRQIWFVHIQMSGEMKYQGTMVIHTGSAQTGNGKMISDVICRQSTSTARDMVYGILEDVQEIPTIEAAKRIVDEYMNRGVFIKPEYLLDVWLEMWNK